MKKLLTIVSIILVMLTLAVPTFASRQISGPFWTRWSEGIEVVDTVEFVVDIDEGGDNTWNNVAFAFANVYTTGNEYPNTEAPGYFEYCVIRLDNWSWSSAGDNVSLDFEPIEFTSDYEDLNGDGNYWDEFTETMRKARVNVKVTRTDETLVLDAVITGENGRVYNYQASTVVDTSFGLYVFCTVDNSTATVYAPGEEVPAFGETSDDEATGGEGTPDEGTTDEGENAPQTGFATVMLSVAAVASLGYIVKRKQR